MKAGLHRSMGAKVAFVAALALAASLSGALAQEKCSCVKPKPTAKKDKAEYRLITGSNIPVKIKDGKPVNSTLSVKVIDSDWIEAQGQGRLIEALARIPSVGRGR